ncbi:restriction endonuclease subunit S [Aeromonas hydrophila]|uniref:restriction endonuclease subunit S n=1 Tax=Aeromonas hydrophila TaxID=644 RepID=UPI003CF1F4C1
MSNSLPQGWSSCTLADIAAVNPKTVADESLIAGFVPMSHAPTSYHGELLFDEKPWGEIKKSYTNFQDGDVIFAKVTPCFENGKAAIVDDLPNGIGAGSSEFYVLRPHCSGISQKLLFAIIKTHAFMQDGATNMTGAVGLRRVPKSFVETFPIALPPAAEQKEIADRLDILLAQVEATQARLARIPDIIKHFRQSVLTAAVSGKLTKEWLATEYSLVEIAEFQNGFAFKSEWFEKSGPYQVIKLGNIRDGHLALDNSPAYVSTAVAKEFSKFSPSTGDTLLSMTGTRFKKDYGFGCLVSKERNLLINQRVGRFIPNRKFVLPVYFNIFIRSDEFRSQFFEGETGGVNQGNVGSKHIMSIRISLPSIETQTEIVRRVEQLFAYADSIEQQAKAAKERVDNLTQAILAKAFRGELTADWRAANPDLISGDNSAAALLARIQAERATVKPRKRASKSAISPTSSGVTQ